MNIKYTKVLNNSYIYFFADLVTKYHRIIHLSVYPLTHHQLVRIHRFHRYQGCTLGIAYPFYILFPLTCSREM